MESVSHDGRETVYRRTGFGDESESGASPVLYVHGSGGTHKIWVHQYGRRGGRPAVALDLSGHGESEDIDTEPGYETLDAYADDVHAVAREVGAGVFVGNSLGGAVVSHLAIERGVQPDALVLCGTGAKLGVTDELLDLLENDFDGVIEFLHETDVLFHDASDEAITASKAGMRECGLRVTRRDLLSCNSFDVRDRLDEIQVPCLAITGEYDGLTPVFFHDYLADNIPTCSQVTLADAAHLSMLEQDEQWNEAVDSFLEGR